MASILNVDKIRATGSTTDALTVDSSGRMLTPNRPMFKVYRTSNTDFGSSQNNTKMTGWDDDTSAGTVNVGGFWSTSNDRATAPVTGMYMFEIKGYFNINTYGQIGIGMYVNGGSAKGADFRINREQNSHNGYDSVNFHAHLYLAASDYVEFYFIQQNGTAVFHTSSGNYFSGVCGHLVG